MRVRNLMTKEVRCCTFNNTFAEALTIMKSRNCGFIPIVDDTHDRKLLGVVTDRDLALFLGWSNRRASEAHLRECYTADVKTVTPDTDLHDVAKLMEKHQIHRVPVVDETRKIIGIISLKDFADEARIDKWTKNPEVKEKEVAEIIEAISDRP